MQGSLGNAVSVWTPLFYEKGSTNFWRPGSLLYLATLTNDDDSK